MKKRILHNYFAVIKIKHLTFIFFLIFILIFLSAVIFLFGRSWKYVSNYKATEIPTVIVDAGHGGEDGGAIALDNSLEKDYNLNIVLKLENILKMNGYKVIMTRTEDIMTCDDRLSTLRERKVSDIHNRLSIIQSNPDAVFVSIHQNKFSDYSQHGIQVFYSGNNPKSKQLADILQRNAIDRLQPDNKRTTKKSGKEIYVLYHAKNPAVLVECGFISNYSDLENLKSEEYKKQLAMVIADGIVKYNQMGD